MNKIFVGETFFILLKYGKKKHEKGGGIDFTLSYVQSQMLDYLMVEDISLYKQIVLAQFIFSGPEYIMLT